MAIALSDNDLPKLESTRRNRRDTPRRPASGSTVVQTAKGVASRGFPPTRIISDDEVESIHRTSLRVLQEIGMDFMLPEARDLLRKAGCSIDGERVRLILLLLKRPLLTRRHSLH